MLNKRAPHRLLSLLLVVVLQSCGSNSDKILPPDKMQRVLIDLQLADVYSTMVTDSLHNVTNKNKDSLAVYYNDIFAHHNITREAFTESIAWYKKNPADLDSVYQKMIPEFSKMESKYPAK